MRKILGSRFSFLTGFLWVLRETEPVSMWVCVRLPVISLSPPFHLSFLLSASPSYFLNPYLAHVPSRLFLFLSMCLFWGEIEMNCFLWLWWLSPKFRGLGLQQGCPGNGNWLLFPFKHYLLAELSHLLETVGLALQVSTWWSEAHPLTFGRIMYFIV